MTSSAQDQDSSNGLPSQGDPIRHRRDIISIWTNRAKSVGYLCFGVAIVAVAVGLLWRFPPLVGQIAASSLVIGSILLAPAIVLGYAVKAAEKEDKRNNT